MPPPRRRSATAGPRFLIDTSVWARLNLAPVRAVVEGMHSRYTPCAILTCPPVVAEVGFSARTAEDQAAVQQSLAAFPECLRHPTTALVLEIQHALWAKGLVRVVGARDTLIAAYAIANEAMVVHYDQDFEFVARVRVDFRHSWVAARGSL